MIILVDPKGRPVFYLQLLHPIRAGLTLRALAVSNGASPLHNLRQS